MYRDRDEYIGHLYRMGFSCLGSGAFSSVYAHPKLSGAFKVSRDQTWLNWMLWGQETAFRRHFVPKLYSVKHYIKKCNYPFFVAHMERVAVMPYLDTSIHRDFIASLHDNYSHKRSRACYWHAPIPGHPGVQTFLNYASTFFDINDIKHSNMGYRADGSLVLFDITTHSYVGDHRSYGKRIKRLSNVSA